MSDSDTLPEFEVFADAPALAEAAAGQITQALRAGLRARGEASFAASGGHTPIPAFDLLRQAPLAWEAVTIVPTDERWVEPTSPDSNEGMFRQHLLTGPAEGARLLPLWSPKHTPDAAAARADLAIASLLPFDVALLGMGDDGHFASLFPGSPVLAQGLDPDGERFCLAVPKSASAPPQTRITLTLRALLDARTIILLIQGPSKRKTFDAAMAGRDLPIRSLLVQDRAPVRVLWAP